MISPRWARLALLALLQATAATAALSPEQEAARLGKVLKPIPDDVWNTVAGERVTQTYEIHEGDTLSEISARLFGDPKYWPKIWALNNRDITNPHSIKPGYQIAFMPGTGTSLPYVAIQDGNQSRTDQGNNPSSSGQGRDPKSPNRSQEWRKLGHQSWEATDAELPPEIDSHGFDERSKIDYSGATGYELEAVTLSGETPWIGEIVNSRSESVNLSLGDAVYIDAPNGLQIGQTYAITGEPQIIETEGRTGYSYLVMGKVKITGERESRYIGTVLNTNYFVPRGTGLMVLPPKIRQIKPIPGPKPLTATLFVNNSLSTYVTAQHKQVILNRGTKDGITPGMVFRAYQKEDPVTAESIARSNSLYVGDIMVIQASPDFSSGIVLSSRAPMNDRTPAYLLTDISDLNGRTDLSTEVGPPAEEPVAEPETLPENLAPETPESDPNADLMAPPPEDPSMEMPLEGMPETAPEETPPMDAPLPEETPPMEAPPSPEALAAPPPETQALRPKDELDQLDEMDTDESLRDDEQRELKQLENWKKNPPESTASAPEAPLPEVAPDAAPIPEPEAPLPESLDGS